MIRRGEIVTRSQLNAPVADVWGRVATFDGINDEFRPLLKMTAPRNVKDAGLSEVVIGEKLCRSWLLLFGVVPIDYDWRPGDPGAQRAVK